MQPPHLLLFLFLPILLPGMWADPEANPQVLQVLLTGLYANISSAEVSSVALVGDIPVFSLDPANWSIHFHWPWVSQAAAEGDAEKIMSQYKTGLRNMIRWVHDTAQQTKQHYPLVVQFRAGCVLYPNSTRHGFLNVGWGGRDIMDFEVDKRRWEARQTSQMAELMSKSLNRQKSVGVLLEYLLTIWMCHSNFETLKRYGREILERQENGSTAPTISIIIAVLLLVATASAGGFWWWKHRKLNHGNTLAHGRGYPQDDSGDTLWSLSVGGKRLVAGIPPLDAEQREQ
ncbi:T-cell surface glycoprotein CD1a [Turdus rufiventris]|nr:T-cell surface glycoprotein CD1a [Turdus rufiventris]